jgi:hypothetical protein
MYCYTFSRFDMFSHRFLNSKHILTKSSILEYGLNPYIRPIEFLVMSTMFNKVNKVLGKIWVKNNRARVFL